MTQVRDNFSTSPEETLGIDQIQRVFAHWFQPDPVKNLYNPYQPRGIYSSAAHHSVTPWLVWISGIWTLSSNMYKEPRTDYPDAAVTQTITTEVED